MGLLDFLKVPQAPTAPTPAPAKSPEPYLGDLDKTGEIFELVETPHEARDEAWNTAFLASLSGASFRCGDPQVIQGPDGFPYVQLLLPESGVGFQCYVIDRMKDDFLLERGLGVVINPDNGAPDWVLSCGDILNLYLNQEFYTTEETPFSKDGTDEIIEEQESVMVGQPAETLLPQVTRNVLRAFLEGNGVAAPKVLLMMRQRKDGAGITQELAFNLSPADFADEKTYRAVMQQLAWFLPRHYSILGIDESALAGSFMPL